VSFSINGQGGEAATGDRALFKTAEALKGLPMSNKMDGDLSSYALRY